MKLHITKRALSLVAVEYSIADRNQRETSGAKHEYWLGKKVAICDTFAYLTGQTYNEAATVLENLAKNIGASNAR